VGPRGARAGNLTTLNGAPAKLKARAPAQPGREGRRPLDAEPANPASPSPSLKPKPWPSFGFRLTVTRPKLSKRLSQRCKPRPKLKPAAKTQNP
jgi:hypothetical protein